MIDHKLECGVLGSALNNHLIAADLCQISDGFFAHREHNVLHSVIRRCVQSTGKCGLTDIQAFLSDIPDRDKLNAYYARLYAEPLHSTTSSARIALDQLREYYVQRKMCEYADIMKDEITKYGSSVAKANHDKRMSELSTGRKKYVSARSYDCQELFRKDPCLPTGITALDAGIIGIPLKQKTIIASRPSVGKTATALSWMCNQAKNNVHGLFISQETNIRPLYQRILSANLEINLSKFRSACFTEKEMEEITKYCQNAEWIDNIHIYDEPIDMHELFMLAEECYRKENAQYVCVDHAGLVQGMNDRYVRRDQIAEYSALSRKFVSKYPVAWVDLWQLNRDAAKEDAPGMHQLRDSGSAEQDADLILILSATKEDKESNRLNIEVAKQRQGDTFALSSENNNPVYFNRSRMIIGDNPRGLAY